MVREIDFVDECYADKDLSLLKKLTLVIPTYNRNYYLSRCLWYHAHFPFGQIIVADSSPEEKKVVNRETVAKIREMFGADILYLEYEPETEKYGGDIYRKWGDAVMHVETEYSIVCTDKEFIIPASSTMCIAFLDSHPDYGYSEGLTYNLIMLNKRNYRLRRRYPHRKSSDDEDGYTRFTNSVILVPPWNNTLLFSISRTILQNEMYQIREKYNINDIRYGEILLAYFGHMLSKDKYYSTVPFKVRDEIILNSTPKYKSVSMGSPESSTTRYPRLVDYTSDYDITKEFRDNFRRCLCDVLSKDIMSLSSQINKYTEDDLYFWNKFSDKPKFTGKYKLWHSSEKIRNIYFILPRFILDKLGILSRKLFNISLPEPCINCQKISEAYIIKKIIESTRKHQDADESVC